MTLRFGQSAPALVATPRTTADEHRARAAWHLYELVKPAGGINWWLLTDGQRARFVNQIRMAERSSDLTAVHAAHEAVAKLLANHADESLEVVPPPIRASYRDQAFSLLTLFERVMLGTSQEDTKILELVNQERGMRARLRGIR